MASTFAWFNAKFHWCSVLDLAVNGPLLGISCSSLNNGLVVLFPRLRWVPLWATVLLGGRVGFLMPM